MSRRRKRRTARTEAEAKLAREWKTATRMMWEVEAFDPDAPDVWKGVELSFEHKLPCRALGEHPPHVTYLVSGSAKAMERAMLDTEWGFLLHPDDSLSRDVAKRWLEARPEIVLLSHPCHLDVDGEVLVPSNVLCIGGQCQSSEHTHEEHPLERHGLVIHGRMIGPFPGNEQLPSSVPLDRSVH